MKRKLSLAIGLGLLIIAASVLWFQRDRVNAPSSLIPSTQDLPFGTEAITISGEIICLPHKDTSGPQTLECAIGIRDDRGVNYALLANDPSQTGSLTGSRAEVTGKLHEAEAASRYDTAGTIAVTSVKKL